MKDAENADTDFDFTKLLGPTVGGEWQVEEKDEEEDTEKGQTGDEEVIAKQLLNLVKDSSKFNYLVCPQAEHFDIIKI